MPRSVHDHRDTRPAGPARGVLPPRGRRGPRWAHAAGGARRRAVPPGGRRPPAAGHGGRAGVHPGGLDPVGGRGGHRRHAVPRRQPDRGDHPPGPGDAPGRPPAAAVRRDAVGTLLDVWAARGRRPARGVAAGVVDPRRDRPRARPRGPRAARRAPAAGARRRPGCRPGLAAHAGRGAQLCPAGRGGRRGRDGAARVARRRPLHLPGLRRATTSPSTAPSSGAGSGLGLLRRGRAMPASGCACVGIAARPGPRRAAACHQGGCALHRAPVRLPRRRLRVRRDAGRVASPASSASSACSPPVAYTESVRRVPLVRGEGRRGAGPRGLRPGRALRPRPAEHPGDLPARRADAGRRRRRAADRARRAVAAGAPPPGCSCAATRRRYTSCLVFLPRDRYTTQVRLVIEVLLPRARAAARSSTPLHVTESVLARLHVVVRARPGERCATATSPSSRLPSPRPSGRWDDDLPSGHRAFGAAGGRAPLRPALGARRAAGLPGATSRRRRGPAPARGAARRLRGAASPDEPLALALREPATAKSRPGG